MTKLSRSKSKADLVARVYRESSGKYTACVQTQKGITLSVILNTFLDLNKALEWAQAEKAQMNRHTK